MCGRSSFGPPWCRPKLRAGSGASRQREPSTRNRRFEGLHGLACARADGRIGLPQLAAEASPSRHDRRSSDRAGGSAARSDPPRPACCSSRPSTSLPSLRPRSIPLVSPLRYAGVITVEGQLMSVVNGAVWLAVLLIVFVRQPDGRLWKLIFVWSLASRIYAFSYVPDSLVWSIARPLEILAIAAYVHLAIAYPTGYLRSRFDRGVVLYVYALLVGTGAARASRSGRSRSPACRTASATSSRSGRTRRSTGSSRTGPWCSLS